MSCKSFAHLSDYVNDFIRYLETNLELFHFTQNEQQSVFDTCTDLLVGMKHGFLNRIQNATRKECRELTKEEQNKIAEEAVQETINFIDGLIPLPQADFATYLSDKYSSTLNDYLTRDYSWVLDEQKSRLIPKVFEMFNRNFFRNSFTGIAIAGYGKMDVFPQMMHLHISSLIDGKVRYCVRDATTISENNPVSLLPLAQTDVMQTFLFGINDVFINDIAAEIQTQISDNLNAVDSDLFIDGRKDEIKNQLDSVAPNVVKKLATKANDEYMLPILQSVATLPIEELALLAESMINITSLRRKVAIDNNIGTVGGPIDVAIISKGDGFIWLKRKHYFDGSNNPQYFLTHYGYTPNKIGGEESETK